MTDYSRLAQLAQDAGYANLSALDRIDYLTELAATVELLRAGEVDRARQAGETWTAIAGSLGVSKQAARKRYGLTTPEPETDPEQLTIDAAAD